MKLLLTLFNNDRKNNFVLLLFVIYCCFLLLVRAKITNSMGLLSLSKFEILISRLLNPNKVQILIPIISLLCGVGIYLGRIQRYNSWDIIGNPIKLIINVIAIGTSTELLLFSFNFGLFIYILYQIYKYLFISKNL